MKKSHIAIWLFIVLLATLPWLAVVALGQSPADKLRAAADEIDKSQQAQAAALADLRQSLDREIVAVRNQQAAMKLLTGRLDTVDAFSAEMGAKVAALHARLDALDARLDTLAQPKPDEWKGLTPTETTAKIQAMLDLGRVELPPGVYPINATLTELVRGDKMPTNPTIFRGSGVDVYGRKDSRMSTGQGTVLKWVGDVGGTMIDVRTDGSRYEHFTLDGNNRAGIGMQWSRVGSGAASPSNTVLDWIRVEKCTRAAWRVGHKTTDQQGDSIDFQNCRVVGCPIGLEVENVQAMQHLFRGHTWFDNVERCYVYKAGGILRVEGQLFPISPSHEPHPIKHTTVLTILSPDPYRKPGKFNGDFHFDWIQSDTQNRGGFRLLDMEAGKDFSGVRVVSGGGRIALEDKWKTIEFANVGRNAELRLDGWTNVKRSDINVAEGGRLKATNMYGHFYGQPWDYDWRLAPGAGEQ
jgi:hypothetical protein